MLIAQISDLHLAEWGQKTFGIAPMAEHLERCVQHINNLPIPPDLVLVTGDITNNGLLEEAERAAHILARLHAPWYILPGNHDDRATLRAAFPPETWPTEHATFIQYTIETEPLRLIGLDTIIPGAPGGEICPDRAVWLEAQLAQEPEKPTLLFMHHPPARFNVIETDIDGFIGAERLQQIVARHPQVQRILAGHIHLASFTQWGSVAVSTAPSMGMHLYMDLTMQRSAYILDDPGYQLHLWTADQRLITHTVRVKEDTTLHPFA